MRTQLAPDNPHSQNRAGFAWHHIPAGSAAHLDFGCGDGGFLASLAGKNIAKLVGADMSSQAVDAARKRLPDAEILRLERTVPLPFGDEAFSSISMLDVLEHVYEQRELLKELHRVLRPGGLLIVTVPRQYALSFLDVGNFKFRFPRLHRFLYRLGHSRQDYERRYVSNPDGLVGDVSAQKRWHEHFSPAHLGSLLSEAGFEPLEFDGSGFFRRVLSPLDVVLGRLGPVRRMLDWLYGADARRFASMNLFCLARRPLLAPTSPKRCSS